MATSSRFLFDQPQQKIAHLISQYITRCSRLSMVAGFATVAGLDRIAGALSAAYAKLDNLVVGAGTYSAYEAFEGLISDGLPPDRLRVHLGMSRERGGGKYERFRPMLHSKIYFFEMPGRQAAAIVGSHNLTAFALGGMNGEASILIEGDADDPAFDEIRRHVSECVSRSVPYDPTMKDAYSNWAKEYFDGLKIEADDAPRDMAMVKTIVILAELVSGPPQPDSVVYFEIPAALSEVLSLNGDVHLYLFDRLPHPASLALSQRDTARFAMRGKLVGMEEGRGAKEVSADWHIADRQSARLETVQQPFRPRTRSSMYQVRAEVLGTLPDRIEYGFDRGRTAWRPELDTKKPRRVPDEDVKAIKTERRRRTESGDWYPVLGLVSVEAPEKLEVALALKESAPGSGSFILVSQRRKQIRS